MNRPARLTMFHQLRDGQAVERAAHFESNTFLIRYADEQIFFGHSVLFEALLDTQRMHLDETGAQQEKIK